MMPTNQYLAILALACAALAVSAAAPTGEAAAAAAADPNQAHEHHNSDCQVRAAQLAAAHHEHVKRQINYPQLGGQEQASNPLSQLSELSANIDRLQAPLKMITGLFNPNKQQQQPPQTFDQALPAAINQAAANQQQPGGLPSAMQIMSSFSELVRNNNNQGANLAAQAQQGGQQVAQQGQAAAQSAQTGIAAALSEISSGLQRIASNNPSLLPDVKSLYSSVSSKLSSASQSAGQAASPLANPMASS